MPNIENVKRVRDMIAEMEDVNFDYSVVLDPERSCGTAACIAGWCWVLNYGDRKGRHPGPRAIYNAFVRGIKMMDEPRKFLGLTTMEAGELFIARGFRNNRPNYLGIYEITRQMVVNTLDHLIETGRVDWAAANPEV